MDSLVQAELVNALVLAAVLEADLGPHRKIGVFRIARPLGVGAAIVPLYLTRPATHGTGLVLEIAAIAVGLLLGAVANALMRVYRSPRTGRPVSRAGVGYAALWVAIIGARAAFSYGAEHWFGAQLGHWMVTNQVSVDALTDALILMAIAMMLTRTLALGGRALAVRSAAPDRQSELVTAR